jgi:hypothetical protein
MKTVVCIAAGLGIFALTMGLSVAEDSTAAKANQLDRYCRQIDHLVKQYYPEATVAASYDEKLKADVIHFEYNTQLFVMRYQDKDGSWQKPQKVIGPYVGGIWCDVTLEKGRYKGDVADAEEGSTEAGPDFYSYLVAPYSKKQDQHLTVKLRYPGGTPPEFLKEFTELAKDFEQYVGERESEEK